MRIVRFLAVVIYVGYLIHVGLLMTILPWSEGWSIVLLQLPAAVSSVFDSPAVRGMISAFGVLHLTLALAEATLPRSVKQAL